MATRELFETKEVFTRDELRDHLSKDGETESLKELIQYHLDRGNIGQVKKGLFYSVEAEFAPGKQPVDSFLIASKATEDAVLGYYTALDLLGHAHSVMHRYYFLTRKAKNHKKFTFRGNEFVPVQVSKSLVENNSVNLEVRDYDRKGEMIDVTTIERTLVDVLDRPQYGGGWEQIWRSFEGVGYLQIENIIEYVRALDNATTAAKVGYFLEDNLDVISLDEEKLAKLEAMKPKQRHYMDRDAGGGKLVSRWNLIVPEYVLNRGWQE